MKSDTYPRLYQWLVKHRRMAFLTALLVALSGTAISSRIGLEEDVMGILPEGNQVVDDYKYTFKKFRQIDRVFIDVGDTNADAEKLGQAADQFYDALATNRLFERFTYKLDFGHERQIVGLLTGALPKLFTESDAEQLAPKLTSNAIRENLTVMRRKLAGAEGMVLKDVVAADPVGMSALILPKVMPLQAAFGGAHVDDGRLLSSNGQHVLIVAEPKFPSSDSKQSAGLVKDMLQAAGAVATNFPGAHVAITGGHRMALDNATLIWRDSVRCIMLAFTAMFFLCLTAYRRRWLATITFLPSLFGTIIAGGVLALVTEHVSAIAIGLASMALGITVDYGIYVVYHLDNAAVDRDSAGKIAARLVLPTIIGALTIIGAFVVLAFSPMAGYRQLGIFGAVGVAASATFALLILPLIVPLPKEKAIAPLRFTKWMDGFHAWQRRHRPKLLLGVLALSVVAAFGLKKLRFEGDIAKLNGITESTREDDKLISTTWGDALSMTLVIARAKTLEEALELNDRAAALLPKQTNVEEVYSIAAVLPSLATQRENIARWRSFWTEQRKAELRANLGQIGGELGFRPEAFAPFWQTIEQPPELMTIASFSGTPLAQSFNERVAIATNDVAVSTVVKVKDREQVDALRAALPGLIVVDGKNFAEHIATIAKKDMSFFAVCTAIVVSVIAFWTLGAFEVLVATLLPIAIGLLWTLGFMGLLGLPINIMNSVFVIFVIGMGEDYSVFLATSKLDVWRGHPPRIAPTSASVLISAVTTILGFAVLVFARHPILFSMGTTVLLGMVSAFTATLVVTPACMDLLLFRPAPTGALRWWHLLGTVQAAVHLALLQSFVYFVQRPVLHLFRARNIPDKLRWMTAYLVRGMLYTLPYGRFKLKNYSLAKFQPPCIVISNHQSAVDVMVLVSWAETVRQTAKKRIFDEPYLGMGCKILGHVMVEPARPEVTMQRCRDRLAEGASVHFYPEGTRSPDGWVQRFHRGAFELAIELKQEIQPVVLADTVTFVPRDAFWLEPYCASVTAIPRITPKNFDYNLGAVELARHCEKIVREALQQELDVLNTPSTVRRKVRRLYRYQGRFIEQFIRWKLALDPMFPPLDGLVPRSGLILDLGCSYGLATHWLAQYTNTRSFVGVDYDEDKIRIARCSAPGHERIRFEHADILEMEYPACDAILLLDVLHYWKPEKQQLILEKARRALRPGGRLIVREAAQARGQAHRHIRVWEIFATAVGLNQTREGLHFQTREGWEAALDRAGFTNRELIPGAGRGSNVMFAARV